MPNKLGFRDAELLFEAVGKDEFSLRGIELVLRPAVPTEARDQAPILSRPRGGTSGAQGGVLVVGVESLLTSLARCCRPAPPDAIGGFVTRGKGVAVHRRDCSNLVHIAARHPERVIEVAWGLHGDGAPAAVYPIDVSVEAADRSGLLRDISEVFVRERINLVGVNTQSVKDSRGSTAWMTFTIELDDARRLQTVLSQIGKVAECARRGASSHRRRMSPTCSEPHP